MGDVLIKIPAELLSTAESSDFEGVIDLPVLQVGPDTYRFSEPVEWNVQVTNTDQALLVTGSARGCAQVECARCLESCQWDFKGVIEGYYLVEGQERPVDDQDEEAPGDDEFDVLPADHVIDLAPLIAAALMVEAPQQPLCDEDCKGLCPVCGCNLNQETCSCGQDQAVADFDRAANPFSVLADFKFSDN